MLYQQVKAINQAEWFILIPGAFIPTGMGLRAISQDALLCKRLFF